MQKYFVEAYTNPPQRDPIADLINRESVELDESFLAKYSSAMDVDSNIEEVISSLDIDHSVKIVDVDGSRADALKEAGSFHTNRFDGI